MTDPLPAHPDTPRDVRMRGFARRTPVADVLRWLDAQLAPLDEEMVTLGKAAGRVLAREVTSSVDVPGFARAMMDGFALRAADTSGASTYNRLALTVIGTALPGKPFAGRVELDCAVRIMTGAPMPEGADAVLPAESAEIEGGRLWACGEVSPGKHVGEVGEDVRAGSRVLAAGRVLRPQDVGVLSSIGCAEVPVVRRPRVRIVITGDELLPAGSRPEAARITDANGPMLEALVERDRGLPLRGPIVSDEPEAVRQAMLDEPADVVLVSGGSSVGQEDHAPRLVAECGELAFHGIAMRPSSPTGLGRIRTPGGWRLVFLLPGNPVSCLCAYDFFAGRAVRVLGGRSADWPYARVHLKLARKVVSAIGRLDYLRVRVDSERVEPLAVSGASVLSSTTRADGFVLIPPDLEGYPPGEVVEVYLYDR